MNRKKWQGTACLLLASLMMSSVFAAPVRKEVAAPKTTIMPTSTPTPQASTMPEASQVPQTTTMPKASQVPQTTTMPKASQAPQATTMPKTTQTPQATTMPKATQTPQATTMPEATAKPQPVESPKVAPCPKTTTCPKAKKMPINETSPNKPGCPKLHQDEKNCEKKRPFTLDHFKMIVNTLKKMGVEENQIVTYIKEGKKLEDILKAEKINTKKFKKCITKEYFKVVDEAVKNGQITVEQSKQLKTAIKETIKNWLPKK